MIEPGWTCSGSPSGCSPVCGDGLIRGTEKCDTGAVQLDGCDNGCVSITPGYSCIDEPSNCTGICGDGIIVGTETCDDKNNKRYCFYGNRS
jgi:cysteine-rich repeat protein